MIVGHKASLQVLAIAFVAVVGCSRQPDTARLAALSDKVHALEQRKTLLEDVNAIERLQGAYGYYVDRGLWDEVANLFADDGTIEIGLDGVYAGKARVREYLYALGGGHQGLGAGALNEHMQVMPAITVAADGLTAKARWRAIAMVGKLGGDAFWAEGRDLSTPQQVGAIELPGGLDGTVLAEATASEEAAALLRNAVAAALKVGVFGSPTIVVDGEPFWGVDRLVDVDEWLAEGGW